ncbi:MAG: hypothetical protein AAFQ06_00975 [Pseudomonadota bacterium]
MSQSRSLTLWQSMPLELKFRGVAALLFAAAVLVATVADEVNDTGLWILLILGTYVIGGEILGFAAAYLLNFGRLSILTWLFEEGLERSGTLAVIFGVIVVFFSFGGLRLFFG